MGFVEKWPSKKMQGQWCFKSHARRAKVFDRIQKNPDFFVGQLALPVSTSPA
jgi:hypothetical protein